MSASASRLPDAGWYQPDPTVASWQWWNGVEWTDLHRSEPPAPGAVHQPPLAAGTSTSTWMNWVLVILPVFALPVSLPYLLSFQSFMRQAMTVGTIPSRPVLPSGLFIGLLTTEGMGLVLMILMVVLAWRDWRALRERGIIRPFHWAWSFLTGVYIVGRQVVVHSRTGGGLTPLWVFIGVYVLVTIGFFATFIGTFSAMNLPIHHP